jgi:hypothetical protein
MKKTKRQRLINKIDKLVRERLLNERGEFCEYCGSQKRIQAAHIFPKGKYPHLRFDLDNILLLCYHHHFFWAHSSPVDFTNWVIKRLGNRKFNKLVRKKNEIVKVGKFNLEEIYEFYKKEARKKS